MTKRRMVKFSRTEHCINFQTISKDGSSFRYKGRSNHFYVTNDEIETLAKTKFIVAKDIYSFVEIFERDKILEFTVTWLESNGHKVHGEREHFFIDCSKFWDWYNSDEEMLKVLDIEEKNPIAKFEFYSDKLKTVINNPILRHKFIKILDHFHRAEGTIIKVYDDFVDYSFCWVEYLNHVKEMNGGIIFHRDYDDKDNLRKGQYQIHT